MILPIVVYIGAIVLANLSVAHFGPAVTILNAFLFIGLDLVLRDKLHDAWTGKHLWPKMLALIITAAVISYLLNPAAGRIGIASALAFSGAALADAAVYAFLRQRRWLVRANSSNVAGAAVDSVLFPTLAFGVFLPLIILGQFAAKVAGGFVWSLLLARFYPRPV